MADSVLAEHFPPVVVYWRVHFHRAFRRNALRHVAVCRVANFGKHPGVDATPWQGGFTFFVIFNSLMEWLVIPLAIFFNWQYPRRRSPLLACAALFYLSRVWTYVYFVPQIFKFSALAADVSIAPDVASDILKWVNLSWVRCALDGVVAILFLRAAAMTEEC